MNYFTIKDIENISGIKAHTIRIWEKRYGIIEPKRKESNHRFYDNEDLKQILRITHLYNNGYKISAIARLQKDALPFVYKENNSFGEDSFIKILLEATIDIDEQLMNETLEKSITVFGLEHCVVKIIYPYFEKIGTLWLSNETLPSQERFACNIIIKKILHEIDKLTLSAQTNKPAIILFTPPREQHEIPLLFMYYLLKKNLHEIYYLGIDVSFDVLDSFLAKNNAGMLFFHLITNLTNWNIENYVQHLCNRYCEKEIIMSGKHTHKISEDFKNLRLLHSPEEMIAFCKR